MVIPNVEAAFAGAQGVSNPDGLPGIALHAAVDDTLSGTKAPSSLDAASYETTRNGLPSNPCDGAFGTVADKSPGASCARKLLARSLAYHYALFADTIGSFPFNSGLTPKVPGTDSIITLGAWYVGKLNGKGVPVNMVTSSDGLCTSVAACLVQLQEGALMHELGHGLGLFHGTGPGPTANFQPNRLSVMNYLFQFRDIDPNRPLDYSTSVLPTLDTSALDETKSVAGTSATGAWTKTSMLTLGRACRPSRRLP